jgi:hypothetical protein
MAALTGGTVRPRDQFPGRRVVLVPVRRLDRPAAVAARQAHLVPADERRAVHVAIDGAQAERLGREWTDARPAGLDLQIVDDAGGVAATIADQVDRYLASGTDEVVVLIGQRSPADVLGRLLDGGTAWAISRAVDQMPGAISALLPVSAGS